MASLSGSVDRIVFRNPESGFCVARFQVADALGGTGATTLVGTMPEVRAGEMLRVTGLWETHPVHGRHFRVETFEEELPSTEDGIERYLASGAIRGIGPVTAGRIVERFGADAIRVMDEEPERLKSVHGISARRLDVIKASWEEQQRIRELSIFLQQHGVSVALARRIYETYGDRARGAIEEDPYRLAHDVHGIGFITADALARQLGVPRDSLSRRVAGLRYVLSESTEDGHVFLPRDELLPRAVKVLAARSEELEPALLELLRRGDAVLDGEDVYLTPFFRAEAGTARLLNTVQATPSSLTLDPRFSATEVVARAAGQEGILLAEKQLQSAEMALAEKVSILTGGPGTGKTSTLRTIITALEAEGISFCLCAPTGRAAKRVAETTGRPASTIHRLLEYQPGINIFAYDTHRPLPYDFVIVDEVSMLDTLLFYHLLKAVPRESHLLLVGDADQLPAVGPGSVLRELLASETIPATTLTELFRQARGSQIILAAHAVNHGEVPVWDNRPDGDFFFVSARSDEEALAAIRRLISERIPRKFGLDPIDDVQVMAPLHGGALGVAALNELLQRELNPAAASKPEMPRGSRTFRVGDKVMQIRNNYEKDVFNGDVGKVVAVRASEQRLVVSFGTGSGAVEVEYLAGELDEIVLAYAVSVHKAQGSEFPCIVMPLVTKHFIMLQRHLLYTAITRARHVCVLVGSERALAIAAATDRREHRNTRLAARIAGHDYAEQLELV
jgi:exodeoxyribonuclease V alpha subunit